MKKILILLQILFCLTLSGAEKVSDPLRDAAEKGDTAAQYKLGNEYFYGMENRKVNYELAAYWYRKAAVGGNSAAQLNYGICLEHGLGVDRDPKNASLFYLFAANKGIREAEYNLALLYLHGSQNDSKLPREKAVAPDVAKAEQHLKNLVNKDFAPAMVELSAVMLNKKDVPEQDRKDAVALLIRAEKLPDMTGKGLRFLADCYYGGIGGLEKDPAMTVSLLKRAIEKKDLDSVTKLAFFYEHGEGVEKQDKQKAFELYKEAALKGQAYAQYKYAEFICENYEKDKGFEYAMEFYERSMAQECPQALHRVALFALKGIGLDKPDPIRAVMLLERAALVGYPASQYSLGCMYAEGDGIPQDDLRSFLWFAEAAKRGHAAAMRKLAICYAKGQGCTKDDKKAVLWLNYAAQAGDYLAIQMLEKNRNNPVLSL